jgi:phage regulator Rha-like protein
MTNSIVAHELLAMSSKEIADLTGKRHADVMRDIRVMTERLEADASLRWHCESTTYDDGQGKPRSLYQLDRDTTMCLIAGYDPIPRMRIIKRWQELEAKAVVSLPQTYLDALKALVVSEEAKQALEAQARALTQQVETDRPYVELARALTGPSTLMTRRDWCAMMKSEHGATFGEKKLNQWLRDRRYIYNDPLDGTPRAYATYASLFKLEPEWIHGKQCPVLKVTGQGVRELTPKVLAYFAEVV